MTLDRRIFIQKMGTTAVLAIGAGILFSEEAAASCTPQSRCRSQMVPPRNRRGPILRAQPPYRHTEHNWSKRTKKSKHKARFKARSLRAQATLDTPGNRRCLALTMWGEARGYGTQGMRCIGHVIMNRVKADKKRFGHGIEGVCYKRKQFSCHNKNDPNHERMKKLPDMDENNPDWIAFMKADKLAGEILAGIDKDNTAGATFYFAESCVPYWIDDMTIIGVMFGHIFCREKTRRQRKHARRAHNITRTHH